MLSLTDNCFRVNENLCLKRGHNGTPIDQRNLRGPISRHGRATLFYLTTNGLEKFLVDDVSSQKEGKL